LDIKLDVWVNKIFETAVGLTPHSLASQGFDSCQLLAFMIVTQFFCVFTKATILFKLLR